MKKSFHELHLVMFRGKCGNKVPALIPHDCAAPFQLLAKKGKVYIDKTTSISSQTLWRGLQDTDVIAGVMLEEQLSDMALNRADLLHVTKLRKYCTTTSQILRDWRIRHGDPH